METDRAQHRLAAIISGDIVGYSRLIGSDEAAAVRLVTAYREEVELLVRQHEGHLVDFTGDNFLAHFSSSLTAVRCAIEIQQVLKARNQPLPDDHKMQFRLGIHQGDVRMEGDRVFGTGVNVAARLEALADPGGICISGAVRDQLQGRMDVRTEDMGSKTVKNIAEPVAVHRLVFGVDTSPSESRPEKKSPARSGALVAAAVFALLLAIVGGLMFTQRASGPDESPVTAEVRDSARSTDVRTDSIGPLPAIEDRPSLVVLPFDNMSGDIEQEYFADGISEDLTTDLAKIPQLFVIARNSAFTYKGKAVDVAQVGRELGVRYLLEGSVRKVQDRVRITAQLIDTSTGFHIWSDRYDRELSDIFAVQNEISEKILSAININIDAAELSRIRRRPIENLNAYEAWHKGMMLTRDVTREGIADGRRLLERAIELQPDYSEAYAILSTSYMAEFASLNMDPALVEKAATLAERAVELSPLSPLSLTSLAGVEMGRFRPDKAIELSKRAVALAPSSSIAYSILGVAQVQTGNFDEGKLSLEQSIRLNPMAIDMNYTMLGYANAQLGESESAAQLWEKVRANNLEALPDRIFLVQQYQSRGQSKQAQAIVKEILSVNPGYTAEQAVEFLDLMGAIPIDTKSVVTGNFKLAGLP